MFYLTNSSYSFLVTFLSRIALCVNNMLFHWFCNKVTVIGSTKTKLILGFCQSRKKVNPIKVLKSGRILQQIQNVLLLLCSVCTLVLLIVHCSLLIAHCRALSQALLIVIGRPQFLCHPLLTYLKVPYKNFTPNNQKKISQLNIRHKDFRLSIHLFFRESHTKPPGL